MAIKSETDDKLSESCGCQLSSSKRIGINFLSCCANPKAALFFLCIATFVQGFVINGILNVSISTLENRFNLQSWETGLVTGTYDIGVVVSILVVTYVGGRGHKPLWIGWGISIMGLGSIIFSLPHFVAPEYRPLSHKNLCRNVTFETCTDNSVLRTYRGYFFAGQILHGIGASPLYTIGLTYIDENVKQIYSATYHGIYLAFSIVGPGLGYIVGAKFLSVFTNIGVFPNLSIYNPLWIGGWWLGFISFGVLAVVLGIPIQMFPRQLPNTNEVRKNREKEMHEEKIAKDVKQKENFGTRLKDMPKSILLLVRNIPLMCIALASAMQGAKIAGTSTFGPKYAQIMFNLSPIDAGTLFGAIAIPAGFIGMFGGGIIVSKLKLTVKKMIIMCIALAIVDFFLMFLFIMTCPEKNFAGATSGYSTETERNISNLCNNMCGCKEEIYMPVCGNNNVTYYSPCHAGCLTEPKEFFYVGCACIQPKPGMNFSYAIFGECTNVVTCDKTSAFLALFFFSVVTTFLMFVPVLQAVIRIVPFHQRSFAVGIKWIIVRCLGTIPGVVVYGAVMDLACLTWDKECGNQASCKVYSNFGLSRAMLGVSMGTGALTLLFFGFSFLFYKPLKEDKDDHNVPEMPTVDKTMQEKGNVNDGFDNAERI